LAEATTAGAATAVVLTGAAGAACVFTDTGLTSSFIGFSTFSSLALLILDLCLC